MARAITSSIALFGVQFDDRQFAASDQRGIHLRIWGVAILTGVLAQNLAGQPALVPREVTGAKSCLGFSEIRSAPVETNPEIVVATIANTLTVEDLAQLQKVVTALYQSPRNRATLRLAMISGAAVEFAGPFKTRAQLSAGFAGMAHPAAENAGTSEAARFYSMLVSSLAEFGGEWRNLLLAGRFPPVPSELTPYAAGWLAGQLRAARLRVS